MNADSSLLRHNIVRGAEYRSPVLTSLRVKNNVQPNQLTNNPIEQRVVSSLKQMRDEGRRASKGTRHCGSDEPGADTGASMNLGGAGNCESDAGADAGGSAKVRGCKARGGARGGSTNIGDAT
jgi:hypothetical protein